MSSLKKHLHDLVAALSAELPEVTERYMFGCDAFFANGHIYSLVWDGRICVKLDDTRYPQALALPGAAPWSPSENMKKGMSTWVMLPDEFNDDPEAAASWVELAHRYAMTKPPKDAKPKKSVKPSQPKQPAKSPAKPEPKPKPKKPAKSPSKPKKAPRR